MHTPELLRCQQHEPRLDVFIHLKNEKIPATLVGISQSGVCLISEKSLLPGTEIEITMNCENDFVIQGSIKMALLINNRGRLQYRLGIEADQILAPEHVFDTVFWQSLTPPDAQAVANY